MKTIVQVITPIITRELRQLDDLEALERPDLEVRHSLLDEGPASIESEFDEALCIPDTIKKAIEAEKNGANAIVIDCMGDPGLDACREVVSIPVLGPCQTAMHLASSLAHSFAFVTVLERIRPLLHCLVAKYGLEKSYKSFRAVNIPVLEIHKDISKLTDALQQEVIKAVQEDGAESIVFGCTGFLGCVDALRDGLHKNGIDVPIIDPIPITVHIADSLVKSGLSHSKITYPTPGKKQIIGYDMPGYTT
jgi:allantoin racemase